MFDILVYLFETYYNPQSCPKAEVLAHKLAAIGFEDEDINDALGWLHALGETSQQCQPTAQLSPISQRIFSEHEQHVLGADAMGFITFLQNSGALTAHLREILIESAMTVDESPVSLDKIKIVALMVLWSHEAEIDHLIFEELLSDDSTRQSH
ncbi:DUF494 domain-containing protein [Providencia rettgeri]|uniref:Protein Smg homolog n=2 Tax=Alcaligenes TaxID=507 RepID=A0A8H9IKL1_9BURK|nr:MULTISPECIES: DUF494 domain-containing protein [Alcaligenes]MBY6347771.1 DUF494 domain-containing protein [Providencia rettgeri]HCA16048.1 hypothetical protein [Alcaligenes faecalis]MCX5465587.1 DUF494 domain-containing protein [Alcaligenes parafaecalis]QTB99119.1 DUF494 domain-containing protein [Alcaligenes sp. SORT26]GHC57230.1 protein Smg [Alcaligenes pakistanensis]